LTKNAELRRAAGLTWFTPIEEGDINIMKVSRYREQIRVALGGRCAEELVYGRENVSVGAGQDLIQVRELARQYVMTSGVFIDELGPQSFLSNIDFLGNQRVVNASAATSEIIESLIRKVITEEHELVLETLKAYRKSIEVVVAELIKRERLTGEEFAALINEVQSAGDDTAGEPPAES
jgi:cell division protease FtsH